MHSRQKEPWYDRDQPTISVESAMELGDKGAMRRACQQYRDKMKRAKDNKTGGERSSGSDGADYAQQKQEADTEAEVTEGEVRAAEAIFRVEQDDLPFDGTTRRDTVQAMLERENTHPNTRHHRGARGSQAVYHRTLGQRQTKQSVQT